MSLSLRPSWGFVILATLWIVAMGWRIYPQFKDTLRFEGRLVTFEDYMTENCGQRIGTEATSCQRQARATGQKLVAREQGLSVLLIMLPLLGYVLIYVPVQLVASAIVAHRAKAPSPSAESADGGTPII